MTNVSFANCGELFEWYNEDATTQWTAADHHPADLGVCYFDISSSRVQFVQNAEQWFCSQQTLRKCFCLSAQPPSPPCDPNYHKTYRVPSCAALDTVICAQAHELAEDSARYPCEYALIVNPDFEMSLGCRRAVTTSVPCDCESDPQPLKNGRFEVWVDKEISLYATDLAEFTHPIQTADIYLDEGLISSQKDKRHPPSDSATDFTLRGSVLTPVLTPEQNQLLIAVQHTPACVSLQKIEVNVHRNDKTLCRAMCKTEPPQTAGIYLCSCELDPYGAFTFDDPTADANATVYFSDNPSNGLEYPLTLVSETRDRFHAFSYTSEAKAHILNVNFEESILLREEPANGHLELTYPSNVLNLTEREAGVLEDRSGTSIARLAFTRVSDAGYRAEKYNYSTVLRLQVEKDAMDDRFTSEIAPSPPPSPPPPVAAGERRLSDDDLDLHARAPTSHRRLFQGTEPSSFATIPETDLATCKALCDLVGRCASIVHANSTCTLSDDQVQASVGRLFKPVIHAELTLHIGDSSIVQTWTIALPQVRDANKKTCSVCEQEDRTRNRKCWSEVQAAHCGATQKISGIFDTGADLIDRCCTACTEHSECRF